MRRLLVFALLCSLLCFIGCEAANTDNCSFCYLRAPDEYVYGAVDCVMVSEERDLSPTVTDLDYLLRLYLDGPISDSLHNPFPKGTYLLSTLRDGDTLTVVLSGEYATLEGIHLTLAGACLCTTCFSLSDAEAICIRSGDQIYTYTRDSFLYLDSSALPTE